MRVAAIGVLCLWLTSCGRSGMSVERARELIVGRWERTNQPGDARDLIEFTADGKYKGVKRTRAYELSASDVLEFPAEDELPRAIYRLAVTRTELTLTLVADDKLTDKVETYRRLD
jgi:hypothetical protein